MNIINRLILLVFLVAVAVGVFGQKGKSVYRPNVKQMTVEEALNLQFDAIQTLNKNMMILHRRIEDLEMRVQMEDQIVQDLKLQETLKDVQ